MSPLDTLIHMTAKLPGLGPRSARRVVLHLLKRRETVLLPLIQALTDTANAVKICPLCGTWDIVAPCALCVNPARDKGLLCVVEDVAALWAMERAGAFKGVYHVLGGTLSALDGVRPTDLRIDALRERIKDGSVREIVLALGATLEGQTTAHYIQECLEETGVFISKLAHGLPVGGEIDVLDEGTLAAALIARR